MKPVCVDCFALHRSVIGMCKQCEPRKHGEMVTLFRREVHYFHFKPCAVRCSRPFGGFRRSGCCSVGERPLRRRFAGKHPRDLGL